MAAPGLIRYWTAATARTKIMPFTGQYIVGVACSASIPEVPCSLSKRTPLKPVPLALRRGVQEVLYCMALAECLGYLLVIVNVDQSPL